VFGDGRPSRAAVWASAVPADSTHNDELVWARPSVTRLIVTSWTLDTRVVAGSQPTPADPQIRSQNSRTGKVSKPERNRHQWWQELDLGCKPIWRRRVGTKEWVQIKLCDKQATSNRSSEAPWRPRKERTTGGGTWHSHLLRAAGRASSGSFLFMRWRFRQDAITTHSNHPAHHRTFRHFCGHDGGLRRSKNVAAVQQWCRSRTELAFD